MIDPNEIPLQCEQYLGRHLEKQVAFIRAEQLTRSTRQAPWRLDVLVTGIPESFVLQLDAKNLGEEYQVLKAMESIPIPTPRVYGLEMGGESLGVPCFFSEFITGETLLAPVKAGESWAEELYLEAVCCLQAVTEEQLEDFAGNLKRETAADVLEDAHAFLKGRSPLVEAVYKSLKATMPDLPPVRFSNGDLWLENFIARDGQLAGVIDFPNAMFSDPLFEFLLSFFVLPELRGRGLEERYCQHMGIDASSLHWYHGLENFDSLRWVMVTGEDYACHSEESLQGDLQNWLEAESN